MPSAWKLDAHTNYTFLITSILLEGKNLISLHIFFLFGNLTIFFMNDLDNTVFTIF